MLAGTLLMCGELRRDEVECEEAVAHLQGCCDGFDGRRIACRYIQTTEGCTTSTTYPDFGVNESECIISLDCATLQKHGACLRALNGGPIVDVDAGAPPAGTGLCK